MKKGIVIFLCLVTSLMVAGQQKKYSENIADLAILLQGEFDQTSIEQFSDSLIKTSPIPIENLQFQGLLTAYIEWGYKPMKSSFLDFATSFDNDTLNQFGFIQYLRNALYEDGIDTARYLFLADSILDKSIHPVIPTLIRNQNYRLKLSTKFPDFEYPLVDGGIYKFSEAPESFLLLEYPLPPEYNDETYSGNHYFRDFSNLKIIRVRLSSPLWRMKDYSDIDLILNYDNPIDQFLNIRSSPRWLLVNKKLELVTSELDLRKSADREKLEAWLKADQ